MPPDQLKPMRIHKSASGPLTDGCCSDNSPVKKKRKSVSQTREMGGDRLVCIHEALALEQN